MAANLSKHVERCALARRPDGHFENMLDAELDTAVFGGGGTQVGRP